MAIIREPEGVDFVVEPHVLTDEDRRIIAEHIRAHKAKQIRITHKTLYFAGNPLSLNTQKTNPYPKFKLSKSKTVSIFITETVF